MTQKRVHLVFKTHLDIGFTDHAEKVRKQYHERFIPQAIETAAHFYAENPEEPQFIWTTGAWLIWDYLNTRPTCDVAKLEKQSNAGSSVGTACHSRPTPNSCHPTFSALGFPIRRNSIAGSQRKRSQRR